MTEWNGAVENQAEDQALLVLKSAMHLWSCVWSSFKVNSLWLWWLSFWIHLLRCGLFLQFVLELWHLPWHIPAHCQCKCQVHYWAKWTDLAVGWVAEWSTEREMKADRDDILIMQVHSPNGLSGWGLNSGTWIISVSLTWRTEDSSSSIEFCLPPMYAGWELDRGKAAVTKTSVARWEGNITMQAKRN